MNNKDETIAAYLEARKQGYDQAADAFRAQIEDLTALIAAYRDAPTIATIANVERANLERFCLKRLSKTITTTTASIDYDVYPMRSVQHTLTITSRPELYCSLCGVRKIYELHHPNWEPTRTAYVCAHCKMGSTNIGVETYYNRHVLKDALRAIEEAKL